MKSSFFFALLLIVPMFSIAQNRARFHHIIEKSKVHSGYLPLVYSYNGTDHVLHGPGRSAAIQYCSDLQGLVTLGGGVATVDFFSIKNSSGGANCLDQATPLGSFRLDFTRKKLGDPTYVYKIPFRAETWSVASVPFRYRFKTDSSFATVSTNLSASVSYGWTIWGVSKFTHRLVSHYSLILGPFVGITTVDLKKSTVKNPSSWTTDRTNFGASYGVSLTYARNNFGLVFSVGADHAFGEQRKQWSYQDKPWLGVGINTGLGLF